MKYKVRTTTKMLSVSVLMNHPLLITLKFVFIASLIVRRESHLVDMEFLCMKNKNKENVQWNVCRLTWPSFCVELRSSSGES